LQLSLGLSDIQAAVRKITVTGLSVHAGVFRLDCVRWAETWSRRLLVQWCVEQEKGSVNSLWRRSLLKVVKRTLAAIDSELSIQLEHRELAVSCGLLSILSSPVCSILNAGMILKRWSRKTP
jgi:hypothetical protein